MTKFRFSDNKLKKRKKFYLPFLNKPCVSHAHEMRIFNSLYDVSRKYQPSKNAEDNLFRNEE